MIRVAGKSYAAADVLAGAYRGALDARAYLVHLVELDDAGWAVRPMCRGAKLDHLITDGDQSREPTCPNCARKLGALRARDATGWTAGSARLTVRTPAGTADVRPGEWWHLRYGPVLYNGLGPARTLIVYRRPDDAEHTGGRLRYCATIDGEPMRNAAGRIRSWASPAAAREGVTAEAARQSGA